MRFRTERWRVHASSLPRVWRHCSGCGESGAFVCSKKFRVNAQKKVIDVWLIYKCSRCDATWNYPIASRRSMSEVSDELRDAFERNDAGLARNYALNAKALRRYCQRIELVESIEVVRIRGEEGNDIGDRIHIEDDGACHWRLDRLLSRELRVSRRQLCLWDEAGRIEIRPDTRQRLRTRIRGNVEVVLLGLNALRE